MAKIESVRALAHTAAQELREEGIHVALLIVDGIIESPKTAAMTAGMAPDALVRRSNTTRRILERLHDGGDASR